jgi:hypothetical protein
MAINTQIPRDEWSNFFISFSNDTRGRVVSVQVIDPVSGHVAEVAQGQLLGIDYDPVTKGNDIILSLGTDNIDATHAVAAPVELWKVQQDTGEIAALEIIDQNNGKTIVSF